MKINKFSFHFLRSGFFTTTLHIMSPVQFHGSRKVQCSDPTSELHAPPLSKTACTYCLMDLNWNGLDMEYWKADQTYRTTLRLNPLNPLYNRSTFLLFRVLDQGCRCIPGVDRGQSPYNQLFSGVSAVRHGQEASVIDSATVSRRFASCDRKRWGGPGERQLRRTSGPTDQRKTTCSPYIQLG